MRFFKYLAESVRSASIATEKVTAIDLGFHVADVIGHAVGDDDVGFLLERGQVVDDSGAEEFFFGQVGFVDDDFDALGFQPLHDSLDAGSTEVVRAGFHHQAIDADNLGVSLDDVEGNEVLAGGIGFDDGVDQVLRHLAVIGKQLLGVLGQAVTTVTKRRVVVVIADAGVEADAVDDLAGVEAVRGGVGVELVEEGNTHGQIGVGEELYGFGFGAVGEQHLDVLLDGSLMEELGKGLGPCTAFADDDAGGVEVVVERPALTEEFGGEDDVGRSPLRQRKRFAYFLRIADRDSGFDHHRGFRVDREYVADHGFDRTGVEVIGFGVVVGGRGDDDVVGADKGFVLVERGAKVERFVGEIVFDLGVDNRRLLAVDHVHLLGNDVERNDFIVLGEKDGVGETDVTGSGDGDFHGFVSWFDCDDSTMGKAMKTACTCIRLPDSAIALDDDKEIFCSAARRHMGVCI